MSEHAVDDALVDAGLPQPPGPHVGVALQVVVGLVHVDVVEQAHQSPPALVLAEVPGETAHDALHGDQVADGDVFLGPGTDQGKGFGSLHGSILPVLRAVPPVGPRSFTPEQ